MLTICVCVMMTEGTYEMSGLGGMDNASTMDDDTGPSDVVECTSTSSSFIFPIMLIFIAAVGLVANFVVIYIIVILREYQKTVTNVYVVQLAAADFLFLFILPFETRTAIAGQWTYGEAWCKITESIRMLNYYASILFLTVMSIDRYFAINHAMSAKFQKFRTRQAVNIISAAVWGAGFLAVLIVLIYAKVEDCKCKLSFGEGPVANDYSTFDYNYTDYSGDYDEDYESENGTTVMAGYTDILEVAGACSLVGHYELMQWIVCNFVVAFVLPLLVICACYAAIIKKIYEPMSVGTKSQKSNNTRKRVTRMVTGLVLVFVVCWLPYHSFMLSRVAGSQLNLSMCGLLRKSTLVLAYLSSALNPFLYTFLGTNFRKRWRNAVGRTRSFRPSLGSRSGVEYAAGRKSRRKSSGVSITGQKSHDDSNFTKNTVIPTNHIVRQEEIKL